MNPVLPVKIYVAHHPNGDTYGIACPDPAVVTQPNTLLRFELQTAGYAFDTEAIQVVDGQGNFIGSWTVSDDHATMVDVLVSEGEYHYWVWCHQVLAQQVSGPRLRVAFPFDPIIQNGSY